MKVMSRREVLELRERYPAGTRVELTSMDDPYRELPAGAQGTVTGVDDIGTVHVRWDEGLTLGLVPTVDGFRKISGEEERHG